MIITVVHRAPAEIGGTVHASPMFSPAGVPRPDPGVSVPDPGAPPRVLDRSLAHALGYTDDAILHQVRRGRWRRVLPHTFLTSDIMTWNDRLHAAATLAGHGALISGAAALSDLQLRSVRRPATVLVLVPPDRCPRSAGWVQIRPSARPVSRALAPGPPRASVARAVCDLAVESTWLDDVRALVAEVVRLRSCTVDELLAELGHTPRRGSAFLRQAVDEVGCGAWSAPEARAATLLRRAGVPAFEQNARIDLPGGRWFVADFLWRSLRAVLEIDSDTHHALTGDAERTADKHLTLETLGFSVVHRTPRYVVTQPQQFTAGIDRWLAGRAAALGLPR
jgi:hypothetical protein